ncbi:hypothetical protein AHAS_Ahas03G0235100 [Arachis hypogaea]
MSIGLDSRGYWSLVRIMDWTLTCSLVISPEVFARKIEDCSPLLVVFPFPKNKTAEEAWSLINDVAEATQHVRVRSNPLKGVVEAPPSEIGLTNTPSVANVNYNNHPPYPS